MKLLIWTIVLVSPWEPGWLPFTSQSTDFPNIEDQTAFPHGTVDPPQARSARGLGISSGTSRSERTPILDRTVGALGDQGFSTPFTNVDSTHQNLGSDQDSSTGLIEHRELRLRDERIKANVCVDDGEQDLCATSIPEIHR